MDSLKSKSAWGCLTADGMDRRSFLHSAAAVGAGLVLSPLVSAETASNNADDINVALLGAGEQGQVLVDACLKIPGVRFKAVCDIWAEYNLKKVSRRLKAYRHEVHTYLDYREMLDKEKDLDAVLIATPDFWHAEQTIACLNAGLDVYCEKEMSNTIEGARKMVQAAQKTGKLLQIGHQRRSNPRYLHCHNKLLKEAKILGRITTINGQWNRSAHPDLGWPEKYAIDQATLEKYGFESMHQFRNWRWYKELGGGPIADLGSHQIDIYNWFLGTQPKTVLAGGGTDYYSKDTHQWYDNIMAIYEYQIPLDSTSSPRAGTIRAFYQTIYSNSCQGYYESFMGDQATLVISESASRGAVYREPAAPPWDKWVKMGYVLEPAKKEKVPEEKPKTGAVVDVRETLAPPAYELAVKMDKLYHQPHLENFFDAIRGRAKLTCPAEVGFETAVTVLKVNEAVEAAKKLHFKPEEFKV
jgi:predicted dehydrogenase